MLTGIAFLVHGPRYIPYGWVFVAVVLFAIAAIFVRIYGRGDRAGRHSGHRTRQTAHHDGHAPERGANRGHRARSRRRQKRH